MLSKKVLVSILVTTAFLFFTMVGSALADEELEKAKVFIEWNTTDGDQGIQFFWDSEGFTEMTVYTNDGSLVVDTSGNILQQGLTETAIESVEPEDSEQTLEEFFDRFPEGTYDFLGTATDGGIILGSTEFTHNLLEPVEFTKVKLPVIEWTEPELNVGTDNPVTLEVVSYELVVELVVEVEVNGEEENGDTVERVFKETTNYPAGFNKHIVGNRFMKLIKNPPGEILELKVEILVEEPSNNKTITEFPLIEEE